jgi:hypothetical protein
MFHVKSNLTLDRTVILLRKVDNVNFFCRQHDNINFILGVLSFKHTGLAVRRFLYQAYLWREVLRQLFKGKLTVITYVSARCLAVWSWQRVLVEIDSSFYPSVIRLLVGLAQLVNILLWLVMVGNAAQAPAHLFSKGIFKYLRLDVVFYALLPVKIYQCIAIT